VNLSRVTSALATMRWNADSAQAESVVVLAALARVLGPDRSLPAGLPLAHLSR
jgi:hypothetical protein